LIINKNECEHDNLIKTKRKRKSKAQSPTNQTLKDELKKKSILKNDKKKKLDFSQHAKLLTHTYEVKITPYKKKKTMKANS
jgi:hypothetical protein